MDTAQQRNDELAQLIAEQERDARNGHRVYNDLSLEGRDMTNVLVGNANVLDDEPVPLRPLGLSLGKVVGVTCPNCGQTRKLADCGPRHHTKAAQRLCYPCSRVLLRHPCGTVASYQQGCRCQQCRAAATEVARKSRARTKRVAFVPCPVCGRVREMRGQPARLRHNAQKPCGSCAARSRAA